MHNHNDDLTTLKWSDLYIIFQNYFFLVDFHHRTYNKLENCKKHWASFGYTDKINCIAQKLISIIDDELLDWFISGVHPSI